LKVAPSASLSLSRPFSKLEEIEGGGAALEHPAWKIS
jgi:hypothetical protein